MSGYQTSGTTDFSSLSQVLGTNIQKISQNVKSIERMVNQLGTIQDSESLHMQLNQVRSYTNQLVKETSSQIQDLNRIPDPADPTELRNRKSLKSRLTEDFSLALKNYQTAQRVAAQKEKEYVRRARANSAKKQFEGSKGGSSNLIELTSPTDDRKQQMSIQMQQEEEIDLEALQEREEDLHKLEKDIMDVNQIFKDLATMVHEQGEMVDSIEAHVESSAVRVSEGTEQLAKARISQSKARRKMVILITIGIVVLVVIILIAVYSSK